MAIQKVVGGDTRNDFGDKYNDTVDEIVISGAQPSNGIIRITKEGGSTFDIGVAKAPNSVISGLSVVINEPLSRAEVAAGSYVLDGENYDIAVQQNVTIDAPDAMPRIDVVVVDDASGAPTGNAAIVKGTPNANPSKPSLASNQLELTFIVVSQSGIGTPEDYTIVRGLNKDCRLATAAALPASTYDDPNNTITADANGALTVDGEAVEVGDRILVKDQSSGLENGIYEVTDTGDGSNPFILTRANDFVSDENYNTFLGVYIAEGSANEGVMYTANEARTTITIGTDDITFSSVPTPFIGDNPTGTTDNTARFDGSGQLVESSALTNDGTDIEVANVLTVNGGIVVASNTNDEVLSDNDSTTSIFMGSNDGVGNDYIDIETNGSSFSFGAGFFVLADTYMEVGQKFGTTGGGSFFTYDEYGIMNTGVGMAYDNSGVHFDIATAYGTTGGDITTQNTTDGFPVVSNARNALIKSGFVNSFGTGTGLIINESESLFANKVNLQEDVATNASGWKAGLSPDPTLTADIELVAVKSGDIAVNSDVAAIKSGIAPFASFAGNPKTYTVTFGTAFSDANYSVSVIGEDERSWTIESKAAGSFIIQTNSNTAPTVDIMWTAIYNGEYKA